MNKIKNKQNRNKIIQSFKSYISPELKPEVELVQQMIREFWQDMLGKKFDAEKKERLEIIFKQTDIFFESEDCDYKGKALNLHNEIYINDNVKKDIMLEIEVLIHEYGHCLSDANLYNSIYNNNLLLEEGTQNLLCEMVINHYLEKHGEVKLNGRKIPYQYPVVVDNSYEFNDGWQKTILYAMRKYGKDIEVFAEFEIGDKHKYAQMVFDDDLIKKYYNSHLLILSIGNGINVEEIYKRFKDVFQNIDKNSIYYRRNWMLKIFDMQNKSRQNILEPFNEAKSMQDVEKLFKEIENKDVDR